MADATDPVAAAAAAALAEAQHFIFVTQIYFCCMYSVVVWDWIVSLPREYKFIWKSSWTAAKISYLFCRYWVLLVMPYILSIFVINHSWDDCQKLYRSPVALAMWNQAGAEVVLLIRTYAFFNRNKYLLAVLCASLGGVLAYQLFVDIHEMLPLPFVTPPFDEGPCFPRSKPGSAHILGFFMASLVFDASVTTMTLWKAFRLRRTCGAASSPLIQTFLREGIFYFVFISIANLVNGIFYLQPKADMSAINIPLSIMLSDILACRMILDLRERGYEISHPTVFTHTVPLELPLHHVHTSGEATDGTSTFGSTNLGSGMGIETASGSSLSKHKGSEFGATQNSLPYNNNTVVVKPKAGRTTSGFTNLIGGGGPPGYRHGYAQERSIPSSMLTSTIDSAMFSQIQSLPQTQTHSTTKSMMTTTTTTSSGYGAGSEVEVGVGIGGRSQQDGRSLNLVEMRSFTASQSQPESQYSESEPEPKPEPESRVEDKSDLDRESKLSPSPATENEKLGVVGGHKSSNA